MAEIESTWKTEGSFIKEMGNAKLEIVAQIFVSNVPDPIVLKAQNVLEIKVVKDINEYYTRVIVTIKDLSNLFAIKLDNSGNCGIFLKFKDIALDIGSSGEIEFEDETKVFKFAGIISKVEVLNMDSSSSTVVVTAIDANAINFNKVAKFSTGTTMDVADILKALLQSVGYNELLNLDYMKQSNSKMFYITDMNSSTNDHIEYLLNHIIDETNGFGFLWSNTVDNKLRIIYSNEIMRGMIDADSPNLILISSAGASKSGDNVANKIKIYSLSSLNDMLSYFKASNLVSFDLVGNKFVTKNSDKKVHENNVWSYERMVKSYSTDKDKTIAPSETLISLDNVKYPNDSNTFTYHIANKYEFVKKMRDGFLTNDLIAVTVPGRAWRNPGELYGLLDEGATTGGRLSGKWFCTKIVDVIGNSNYQQTIFLCRGETFETTKEFADAIKTAVDAEEEKK